MNSATFFRNIRPRCAGAARMGVAQPPPAVFGLPQPSRRAAAVNPVAWLAFAVVGLSTSAIGQLPGWGPALLSPRFNHAMAYDAGRGVTVLFGGCANTTCQNGETWEWNGTA